MIGFLGGTFDPVHYGHLRLALEVVQQLSLEELRLIPLGQPAHRQPPLASATQRCAMLGAAVGEHSAIKLDDREIRRQGISYTVDTLLSLRENFGDRGICMVLGTDAYSAMQSWHQAEQLCELTNVVIAQRPGDKVSQNIAGSLGFRTEESVSVFGKSRHGLALHLSIPALEISSSAVRALIGAGKNPQYLLPDSVIKIINEQGLYH